MAEVAELTEADEVGGVAAALAPDFGRALTFAMKMAWTSETYDLHPWMLVLGVLRYEEDTAAKVGTWWGRCAGANEGCQGRRHVIDCLQPLLQEIAHLLCSTD